MNKTGGALLAFLGVLGGALAISSHFGDSGSTYEWADETEMKSHGVTDDELAKLVKAYERRRKGIGPKKLDADTKATRYVYVAVANAEAAGVQRLLRGVMCPETGNPADKIACDAKFSADKAGRACNAAGNKVAYVIGIELTAAQRSVLGKWRSAFNLTHITSVPMSEMRQGSLQFWGELETLYGVKRCPLGELTP